MSGFGDPDKVGLLRFAKLTYILWLAAKNDDPYAEWRLMELYEHMATCAEGIKKVGGTVSATAVAASGTQDECYTAIPTF